MIYAAEGPARNRTETALGAVAFVATWRYNIQSGECRRIFLELASKAEELAEQWDAIAVAMCDGLGAMAAK